MRDRGKGAGDQTVPDKGAKEAEEGRHEAPEGGPEGQSAVEGGGSSGEAWGQRPSWRPLEDNCEAIAVVPEQ